MTGHHQSTKRIAILAVIGLIIWWLYRATSASASELGAGGNTGENPWRGGYLPPNDPRRSGVKHDPSLLPGSACADVKIKPVAVNDQPQLYQFPNPSNIQRQFPPNDYPWLYR